MTTKRQLKPGEQAIGFARRMRRAFCGTTRFRDRMLAGLTGAINAIESQKRSQPAPFAVNWHLGQPALAVAAADVILIGGPGRQMAVRVRVIKAYHTLATAMLEDGGLDANSISCESANNVLRGAHCPIGGAESNAPIVPIYRLQQLLKIVFPDPDDLVEPLVG